MTYFRVRFVLSALGPRVAEAGDGRIAGFSYSGPFEDVRLKP